MVGDGFAASHFFLDLVGLRFCDCAGLNLFLRVQQRARAAGGSVTYRGRYAEQVTMEGISRALTVLGRDLTRFLLVGLLLLVDLVH